MSSAAAVAHGWSNRIDIVEASLTGGPAALLIRPDGYVAWAADDFESAEAEALQRAMGRWFGAAD